jgi:carboxypeptidase C (cathepsin A)
MKTNHNNPNEDDDLYVPEFDFDNAVPNKFAGRFAQGVQYEILGMDGVKRIFVQLDEDLAQQFSTPQAVNDALRWAVQHGLEQAATPVPEP